MIVLIALLVFCYRLPNSIVISSRSGLQTLVLPPTFSKGWSVLRISVIFKPWQRCCFSTEKQYIPWNGSKKKYRLSLTTATNFLTGLVIGLVGSNLGLLAAGGFSVESYFIPYLLQTQRNKSTTWTKVYLSQVASAHDQPINGFANSFSSKHSVTNAFPHGNGCNRVVDFPNGHFSKKNKNVKTMIKHCCDFLWASNTLRIHGGN